MVKFEGVDTSYQSMEAVPVMSEAAALAKAEAVLAGLDLSLLAKLDPARFAAGTYPCRCCMEDVSILTCLANAFANKPGYEFEHLHYTQVT